jgi:hypothetical protein
MSLRLRPRDQRQHDCESERSAQQHNDQRAPDAPPAAPDGDCALLT